jgi:hypothetical protein
MAKPPQKAKHFLEEKQLSLITYLRIHADIPPKAGIRRLHLRQSAHDDRCGEGYETTPNQRHEAPPDSGKHPG